MKKYLLWGAFFCLIGLLGSVSMAEGDTNGSEETDAPKLETRFYAIPGWVNQNDFLELVTQMVYPESWADNGGEGLLSFLKGRLMMTAEKPVCEQFELLLKLLTNEPIPVDEKRLALEEKLKQVVENSFERKSLTLAMDELAKTMDLNVRFDTKEIKESGAISDIEGLLIRQNAKGISLAALLDLWLERWSLDYYLDKNAIVITTRDKVAEKQTLKVYDLPTGCEYEETMEAIEQLVYPDSWSDNGGTGVISPFGGRILALQTERTHRQIQRFLDLVNGKSIPVNLREAKIEAVLNEPTDLSFQDVPAGDAINQLQEKLGVSIQWDLTNEQCEAAAEEKLTFQCAGIRLESALNRLCGELNLAWTVKHESIFIIAHSEYVENDASHWDSLVVDNLQSYDFLDYELKSGNLGRQEALERIYEFAEPYAWEDNGGPGACAIIGNKLLVRLSRGIHKRLREFRNLLAEKPTEATDSEKAVLAALKTVKPMSFNKLSLDEFVDLIRTEFQIEIAVERSVHENPGSITVRGKVADLTLEQVLQQVLSKSDLNWVLRDETLTIVYQEDYENALETKFYRLSDKMKTDSDRPGAANEITEALINGVDPNSWQDNGGGGRLSIIDDVPGLLVLQTREGQRKAAQIVEQIQRMDKEDQQNQQRRRTSDDPNTLVDRVYSLPVFEEEEGDFMTILTTYIAPKSWKNAGGNGEFRSGRIYGDKVLFVRQTEAVHTRIKAFLEEIMEDPQEDFPLKRALGTIVDVKLNTTLDKAITELADRYACPVDIEKATLTAAGIDLSKTPAQLTVRGVSLNAAFNLLLRPSGLVCAPDGTKLWIGADQYSSRRSIRNYSSLLVSELFSVYDQYLRSLNNGAFPDSDSQDEKIRAIYKRVHDEEMSGAGAEARLVRRLTPEANWSEDTMDRAVISLSGDPGFTSPMGFANLLLIRQTPYGHERMRELARQLKSGEELWTAGQMRRYVAFNAPIGSEFKGKTLNETAAVLSEKLNTPILIDSRSKTTGLTAIPFDPAEAPLRETLNRLSRETDVVWGVVDETILLTDAEHADALAVCCQYSIQMPLWSESNQGGLSDMMGSMAGGGGGTGGGMVFQIPTPAIPVSAEDTKNMAEKAKLLMELLGKSKNAAQEEQNSPDSQQFAELLADKIVSGLKSFIEAQDFPGKIGSEVYDALHRDEKTKQEIEEGDENVRLAHEELQKTSDLLKWRVPSPLWATDCAFIEGFVVRSAPISRWVIVRQTSGVQDQIQAVLEECSEKLRNSRPHSSSDYDLGAAGSDEEEVGTNNVHFMGGCGGMF